MVIPRFNHDQEVIFMIVLILPPNLGEMMPNVDLRVFFSKWVGCNHQLVYIYIYIYIMYLNIRICTYTYVFIYIYVLKHSRKLTYLSGKKCFFDPEVFVKICFEARDSREIHRKTVSEIFKDPLGPIPFSWGKCWYP